MSIVGSGDIASVLPDRRDLLFFASGVSNSQETRESEYQREKDLLLEQDRKAHLVYFGSLAIFYADNRYVHHKLEMESMVKRNFEQNTIVRIGNINWGTNPHTLINYLREHPEAEIRDEVRYVVGKEEFLHWIGMIPLWNCEINLPGRKMTIKEIQNEYGRVSIKQI